MLQNVLAEMIIIIITYDITYNVVRFPALMKCKKIQLLSAAAIKYTESVTTKSCICKYTSQKHTNNCCTHFTNKCKTGYSQI